MGVGKVHGAGTAVITASNPIAAEATDHVMAVMVDMGSAAVTRSTHRMTTRAGTRVTVVTPLPQDQQATPPPGVFADAAPVGAAGREYRGHLAAGALHMIDSHRQTPEDPDSPEPPMDNSDLPFKYLEGWTELEARPKVPSLDPPPETDTPSQHPSPDTISPTSNPIEQIALEGIPGTRSGSPGHSQQLLTGISSCTGSGMPPHIPVEGRLRDFLPCWQLVTKDRWVLTTIGEGIIIPLQSSQPRPQKRSKEYKLDSSLAAIPASNMEEWIQKKIEVEIPGDDGLPKPGTHYTPMFIVEQGAKKRPIADFTEFNHKPVARNERGANADSVLDTSLPVVRVPVQTPEDDHTPSNKDPLLRLRVGLSETRDSDSTPEIKEITTDVTKAGKFVTTINPLPGTDRRDNGIDERRPSASYVAGSAHSATNPKCSPSTTRLGGPSEHLERDLTDGSGHSPTT
ncbi:hypothetical protein HDU93_005398 [Gonapodya sp. JEL0774]|nr:hypothetical protein HDU93_005398 [Gonapodya sp. JEL0774]